MFYLNLSANGGTVLSMNDPKPIRKSEVTLDILVTKQKTITNEKLQTNNKHEYSDTPDTNLNSHTHTS